MNLQPNSLVAAAVAATLLSSHVFATDAATAADAAAATTTAAADTTGAPSDNENDLSEIIVTGTRTSGLKAIDSPAPVQVVDSAQLSRAASSPDLIQNLATLVPSLAYTTTGGDLSNDTLQAALRSLSPNDTLVLVNGKRRHTTANFSVGGSGEFSGGAASDLNFIPADSIDHIEVLTDGAAAQYGSDAIAGVINIITKKDSSGGDLQAEYGGYLDGGGKTDDVSGHIGFEPYAGAYLNFTGEFRNVGHAVRTFPIDYTTDAANLQAVAANPGLTNGSAAATAAGLLWTGTQAYLKPVDINVLNADHWPAVNLVASTASNQIKLASFDSGFKLGGNAEFYAFGTYGQKDASALQQYRLPHIAAWNPADPTNNTNAIDYGTYPTSEWTFPYPYGFTPLENTDETDYGLTGGLKGALANWNWDVSSTYGRDYLDFYTLDSINQIQYSLTGFSPLNFYDGAFKATQWTNNLDLDHDFDVGLTGPLNVALGAEQRRDAFGTSAGIPLSYQNGGAAAFAGFSPTDAGGHSRTNSAGYIDLAAKVVGGLRLDIAGRYEHYSDFGDTRSGKFTARYDFNPVFAVRGTVSNGFRAPSVAEEYYTKTSTSPTSTGITLAADSAAAQLFGFGKLQPETSVNYSFGFVFSPLPQLTGTLDLYHINVDHRIVSTQSFYETSGGTVQNGQNGTPDTAALVGNAITINGNQLGSATAPTTSVSFYTNGVDTSSDGADLALAYLTDFGQFGNINWSLKANYNKIQVTGVKGASATLQALGVPAALNSSSLLGITGGLPKYDIQFGGLWTFDKLSVNLLEVVHGTTYAPGTLNVVGGAPVYYVTQTGTIPITNVDISYEVLKSVRLSAGAVNIFNRYPEKTPAVVVAANQAAGSEGGAANLYVSGPIGIAGGFYYVKATYTF